jgi:hypothetical protein
MQKKFPKPKWQIHHCHRFNTFHFNSLRFSNVVEFVGNMRHALDSAAEQHMVRLQIQWPCKALQLPPDQRVAWFRSWAFRITFQIYVRPNSHRVRAFETYSVALDPLPPSARHIFWIFARNATWPTISSWLCPFQLKFCTKLPLELLICDSSENMNHAPSVLLLFHVNFNTRYHDSCE